MRRPSARARLPGVNRQRVILDAAIERSVIRGTLTATTGPRSEFHGWLELNTALEAILDPGTNRAPIQDAYDIRTPMPRPMQDNPLRKHVTAYDRADGIATIKMDDGKVNALGIPMLRELHAAFDRAEEDNAIVILTGREGRFSAGFDLNVFSDTPEQLPEMLTLGANLCERILTFPRPVVTACTGHGVAAGCFIQLAADLRLGVDGPFQIGLSEVRIGLTMPQFVVELARSRLTPSHFDRAVNSAVMYAPADAVSAGFLDRVVSAEELQPAALDAARGLSGLNTEAHKATKLKSRAGLIDAVHAAIAAEFNMAA